MSGTIWANVLLFGALALLMVTGIPVAFCFFAVGLFGLMVLYGPLRAFHIISFNTVTTDELWLLNSIPLFAFMAYIIQYSGIAEDLYHCLHLWLGGVRGGLAMATLIVGGIMGALVGEGSAAVLTLGVVALPPMLKRGYDRNLAMGTVLAGGGLAAIIPPSVLLLVYSEEISVSFRRLFIAGIVPGILIAFMCLIYIGVICFRNPRLGPPIPPGSRGNLKEKINSLRALIVPAVIIAVVFAMMFIKYFFLSEAATLGAFGALITALVRKRLTWQDFKTAALQTLRISVMIVWVVVGARVFRSVYFVSGAVHLFADIMNSLSLGSMGAMVMINVILLAFGTFLDPFIILMFTLMVVTPLFKTLGIDPVYFGVVFVVNMMLAEISPPVGYNIFCLQAVASEGTRQEDIYRAAIPFALIHVAALFLLVLFPSISLWLPGILKGTALW